MHEGARGTVRVTVVASNERVAVIPPQLAVDVLLCLLQRNVHVAIDRLEFP